MIAGDIALLNFPFSSTEAHPFKRRPVLVVGVAGSGGAADRGVLVAMITSSASRIANPGRNDLPLAQNDVSNLLAPSLCRTNRLWVAEDQDIERTLGSVSADELAAVKRSIVQLFALR